MTSANEAEDTVKPRQELSSTSTRCQKSVPMTIRWPRSCPGRL